MDPCELDLGAVAGRAPATGVGPGWHAGSLAKFELLSRPSPPDHVPKTACTTNRGMAVSLEGVEFVLRNYALVQPELRVGEEADHEGRVHAPAGWTHLRIDRGEDRSAAMQLRCLRSRGRGAPASHQERDNKHPQLKPSDQ